MKDYFLTLALIAAPLSPAVAQDFFVYGGGELELEPNGADSGASSNVSTYLELEKSHFYAGVSGELAMDPLLNEVDLYLGYRSETASGLTYDVGYTLYYYPNDGGNCCGEMTLSLGKPFGDKLNVTFDAAYDPQSTLGNAYVGLEFYANDKITLSANYGSYQVDGADSEQEWDVGIGYALSEEASAEVRYYDGTDYANRYVGLNLIWDTTFLSR